MATPTIIGSGSATYATAATLPTGLRTGDIILVSLTNADYVVENITPPTGYKLLREYVNTSGEPTQSGVPAVLYKKASSADSGATLGPITFPNGAFGSNNTIISYIVVRGGDVPTLASFLWSSVSTSGGAAASVSVSAQVATGPSLQVMALTANGNGQAFSISGTGWSLDTGSYINRWQPQAQWASCSFATASAGNAATALIASANARDPFVTLITIPAKMEYAYQSAGYQGDAYTGQLLAAQVFPPNAPFNLSATRYAQPFLLISWTGSANTATFEIQRSPDGVSSWTSLATGIVSPSYLDTTTTWGTTYYYRVQATNSAGSSSWSATFTVAIPNGDDGDWLYLHADVVPKLVESDGDWLYLNADVIPNLVESDGDWLYINANVQPSTVAVGFIMDAPVGTLYMYGTAPAAGFTLDAPAGQPLLFIPALPAGFTIDAPAGDLLQVVTAAPAGFVLDAPAGIGQLPPSLPLTAYENVGFQTPLPATMFLTIYENVGFGPMRKKPTIFVGGLYVAPRTLGVNIHAMVLFSYENVGFFIRIDPESVLYAYEDVTP